MTDLWVAQGKVGVFEEDPNMHPSHIQLTVPFQLHLMTIWQGPILLTPSLACSTTAMSVNDLATDILSKFVELVKKDKHRCMSDTIVKTIPMTVREPQIPFPNSLYSITIICMRALR